MRKIFTNIGICLLVLLLIGGVTAWIIVNSHDSKSELELVDTIEMSLGTATQAEYSHDEITQIKVMSHTPLDTGNYIDFFSVGFEDNSVMITAQVIDGQIDLSVAYLDDEGITNNRRIGGWDDLNFDKESFINPYLIITETSMAIYNESDTKLFELTFETTISFGGAELFFYTTNTVIEIYKGGKL